MSDLPDQLSRSSLLLRPFAGALPAPLCADDESSYVEWRHLFGETAVIEFQTLVGAIAASTGERMSHAEEEVLAHIVDTVRTKAVTIFRFVEFSRAFGPVGARCMHNLRAIVSHPWFCGFLTERESELMLFNQPPGTFLVRFSSSDVGGFSITGSTLVDAELR